MTTLYDADQLSRSLIADAEGNEGPWRNYARVFLTSLLRQLHRVKHDDVGELYRLISTTPVEDLRDLSPTPPPDPISPKTTAASSAPCAPSPTRILSALEHIARQDSRVTPVGARLDPHRAGRTLLALQRQRDRHPSQHHQHLDATRHLRNHEPARTKDLRPKPLVRHRRTRRLRPDRRPERRPRQTPQIRRPLRLRLPIHRPSLRHLRACRSTDDCRELRQHSYIEVLRLRRRRHSTLCLKSHRRARGTSRTSHREQGRGHDPSQPTTARSAPAPPRHRDRCLALRDRATARPAGLLKIRIAARVETSVRLEICIRLIGKIKGRVQKHDIFSLARVCYSQVRYLRSAS